MKTTAFCLAALAATVPRPTTAQTTLLEALAPGMVVRVETASGQRLRGTVAGVDTASVVLRDGDVERRLVVDSIRAVWQLVPSTHRFAAGGAIVGAAGFGGAIGLLAAAYCERSSCSGEFLRGFLVGAPIGALGGAAFGALAGAAFRHWVHVTPRSPGTPPDRGLTAHLGLSRRAGGEGPAPWGRLRVGMYQRLQESRLGSLELSYLVHARETLSTPASPEPVSRDASTWTVSLGLTQELGELLRLNASVGLARSTLTVDRPPLTPSDADIGRRSVQLSSQVSAGIEASWRLASEPAVEVGLEGRYDYIPLFLDGIQLVTLSIAVRG